MKKVVLALCAFALSLNAAAQESSSVFNLLKVPVSAHAAALGGNNVSLIEDDPTLTFANPALLASVSDKTLNLNFMTYMKGSNMGSASFVKTLGDRHTLGLHAQYMDYGTLDETNEEGDVTGTFSAQDIVVGGQYSYQLTERWVGGATLNFLYSKYAEYSSFALGVDVGLNYFDEDRDFSFGLAMRNVGAQIKRFDESTEHLPFTLEAGVTKGVANAPIRLSLTLIDLTRWSSHYYYNPDNKKDGVGRKIVNHLVFGAEVLPTSYLYIGAGYNPRRAREMKAADKSHGAGWSFGGGVQLTRLKFGVAYGKYHQAASSLLFNLSYKL